MSSPISSPMDPDWVYTLKVPSNYFRPGKPFIITARYMCQTRWNDFVEGGARASKERAWRSAATKLTEAEKADPSEDEGTLSYILIGFAYPKSHIDVAREKPNPWFRGEWLGSVRDDELGLVVVALNDADTVSFQMYLLLDMMDGLCTPYKFDQGHVFYLPEFRVNIPAGKTRWQHWNQIIRIRARGILEDGAEDTSDEELSLDNGAEESSVSEAHPDSHSDEEMPDDDMSLFVCDGILHDIIEAKSDEEESLAEVTGESSKRGESQASNYNDADDPGTNSNHTLRLVDELSQMTAVCENSQDIQHIDHTLRLHLAQNPYQQKSAMREFLDLNRQWDGRDSHAFCVEMTASGQLDKVPRLSEVASIREALVHLKANLDHERLGKFFKFTMVLLKDEHTKPIPQDAVNYAVLKSLELLATLQQAS
ncbi:hypothetical protein PG996_011158 [Apiospora saccharicola]|uniref:Uncharacterized protein n=1 Tax=Apiospora saccharicola TaxID=335842 RepID=A0ABR1UEC3_9PEZI